MWRPTRLTSYSATLIDNIFTNNISALCDNGLIINDLSDHLPIFTRCYTDAHSSWVCIFFVLSSCQSVTSNNVTSISSFKNLYFRSSHSVLWVFWLTRLHPFAWGLIYDFLCWYFIISQLLLCIWSILRQKLLLLCKSDIFETIFSKHSSMKVFY